MLTDLRIKFKDKKGTSHTWVGGEMTRNKQGYNKLAAKKEKLIETRKRIEQMLEELLENE